MQARPPGLVNQRHTLDARYVPAHLVLVREYGVPRASDGLRMDKTACVAIAAQGGRCRRASRGRRTPDGACRRPRHPRAFGREGPAHPSLCRYRAGSVAADPRACLGFHRSVSERKGGEYARHRQALARPLYGSGPRAPHVRWETVCGGVFV